MHQEMPMETDRMLGFQLWLNLPQKEKMAQPAYLSITPDMIPVVPAAHYQCGGVLTDVDGRTDLKRLYAIGEVAFTGLHGDGELDAAGNGNVLNWPDATGSGIGIRGGDWINDGNIHGWVSSRAYGTSVVATRSCWRRRTPRSTYCGHTRRSGTSSRPSMSRASR